MADMYVWTELLIKNRVTDGFLSGFDGKVKPALLPAAILYQNGSYSDYKTG